jgi:nitrous oxide reductase accessory protein NosL
MPFNAGDAGMTWEIARKAIRAAGVVTLLFALVPAAARAAESVPPPGSGERCPVCGMFVALHPTWVAALRRPDGAPAYFDGPKDLFRWLLTAKGREQGGEPIVTDYYSTQSIAARGAWFVAGSDVLGPMGRELVPFASEKEARGFLRDHGGTAVLPFADVTPEVLRALE